MAHQINLYSPILVAPRRLFSARAMAMSLAVLGGALVLLCGWAKISVMRLERDLAATDRLFAAERRLLNDGLGIAAAAGPAGTGALEQELAHESARLAERRLRLAELERGLVAAGRAPSELLFTLARTLPDPIWLREVRAAEGRLDIAGSTSAPEAVAPWIEALSRQPSVAAIPLALLRVESDSAGQAGTTAAPQSWSFQIGPPPPALAR